MSAALQNERERLIRERDACRQRADSLGEDVISLLHLLADIREAAGDPEGTLMQPELVERIRTMHDERAGMALVPREITAESGHKAGMMSEFSQSIPMMCEACDGDGEDEHDDSGVCSECDGAGEYELNVNISWTTIKAIHRRIVEIAEGGAAS